MASKLLVNELQAATGTDITITAGHSLVGAASVFKIAGGIAGQALITDGAGNISFGTVSSLPTQSGQAGKFLKTDGTDASWGTVATDPTMGGDLTGTASNAQIAAGAVDLVHMSADSVDSDQYVDGSIDNAHLAANSVDSDQYVDGSIDTDHIAANAVTGAKIAMTSDAQGDVLFYGGTDYERLAAGTSGYFLKTLGSGADPAWAEVPAGAPTGGGTEKVFYENENSVDTDYTLTTNYNAVSAGPVTVASGVTVTIPAGQAWVIV